MSQLKCMPMLFKNNNKNKNNFNLHRIFKIPDTSCQLFIDEMIYTIYTNIYRLHYDKTSVVCMRPNMDANSVIVNNVLYVTLQPLQ